MLNRRESDELARSCVREQIIKQIEKEGRKATAGEFNSWRILLSDGEGLSSKAEICIYGGYGGRSSVSVGSYGNMKTFKIKGFGAEATCNAKGIVDHLIADLEGKKKAAAIREELGRILNGNKEAAEGLKAMAELVKTGSAYVNAKPKPDTFELEYRLHITGSKERIAMLLRALIVLPSE